MKYKNDVTKTIFFLFRLIRLKVETENVRKNITNVFGVFKGDLEPGKR